MSPIQKILFGSPGTGKSYEIRKIAEKELSIEWNEQSQSLKNTIKTVFHPEYTYSDFVGKLLPQTTGNGSVIYKFYAGHFLQALGLAYKKIIDGTDENVLLVIDELNRGNAAAIFGSIFQLLDREENNWSSYEVNLSEIEIVGLLREMKYNVKLYDDNILVENNEINTFYNNLINEKSAKNQDEKSSDNKNALTIIENLRNSKILIPNNLSIIATINTSDESIYYLDSAFKRRWDWEYVDVIISQESSNKIKDVKISLENRKDEISWIEFVNQLNKFIRDNPGSIRKIEDKQIGCWFLKARNNIIDKSAIKYKLMFYLWDSVFSKDKKPLETLLKSDKLITFADFANLCDEFVVEIKNLNK
jgi:hypothetical protein